MHEPYLKDQLFHNSLDILLQLYSADGKQKALGFYFFIFFERSNSEWRMNGIPGSRCLSLKANYDSVSSLLMPKGEEIPEKEDQDFQGNLVLSASSIRIKQQMRALLASFICTASPPRFLDTCTSFTPINKHTWMQHKSSAQFGNSKDWAPWKKKIAVSISEAVCASVQ